MLVKEKYLSQRKYDAEDLGCHLINNGLQVVKKKKKEEASLAHTESIPFCAGRKITIYFPYNWALSQSALLRARVMASSRDGRLAGRSLQAEVRQVVHHQARGDPGAEAVG